MKSAVTGRFIFMPPEGCVEPIMSSCIFDDS